MKTELLNNVWHEIEIKSKGPDGNWISYSRFHRPFTYDEAVRAIAEDYPDRESRIIRVTREVVVKD